MLFSKFLFGIIDSKLPFFLSDIKCVSVIGHTQRLPFLAAPAFAFWWKRQTFSSTTVVVVGTEISSRILCAFKHPWHLTSGNFRVREDGPWFVMENTGTLSGGHFQMVWGMRPKSLRSLKIVLKGRLWVRAKQRLSEYKTHSFFGRERSRDYCNGIEIS